MGVMLLALSAWVLVDRAGTGTPAAATKVELSLLEGGLPRVTAQLVTNAAGTAFPRARLLPRSGLCRAW